MGRPAMYPTGAPREPISALEAAVHRRAREPYYGKLAARAGARGISLQMLETDTRMLRDLAREAYDAEIGFTITELAYHAGVSRQTMSAWLSDDE